MAVLSQRWSKFLTIAWLGTTSSLGWAWPLGQTLDRVVAAVDDRAITQSDVETEYRLEVFLSGKHPDALPDHARSAQVRDRLIDRMLLSQEAEEQQVNPAEVSRNVEKAWTELRKSYPDQESFESALRVLGLDQEQVLRRLEQQERMLLLIDQRLRPAAWVERSQVETYYRDVFLPEYTKQQKPEPPPLAAVESQIRELLVQKEIDKLMESWLKEVRSLHRVRVFDL